MKRIILISVLMGAASIALGAALSHTEPDTALTVSANCVNDERMCSENGGAVNVCHEGNWNVVCVCETFHFCDPVFADCLREPLAARSGEEATEVNAAASNPAKEEPASLMVGKESDWPCEDCDNYYDSCMSNCRENFDLSCKNMCNRKTCDYRPHPIISSETCGSLGCITCYSRVE